MKLAQIYKTVINYFKTLWVIKRAIKDENLLEKLTQTFGYKFRVDKIGRIYTVINPIIQNIGDNGNSIIYDGNNEPMIREYLIKNMMILKSFIGDNDFFDILTYDIKKIDVDQNYLVILKPIFLDDTIKYFQYFLYIILCLVILCVTYFVIS